MTIAERLSALYTERADLLARIDETGRDLGDNPALRAAIGQSDLRAAMTAAAGAVATVEKLKKELEWTEKQILALLANPAIGGAP
jgi:hypothetical protein